MKKQPWLKFYCADWRSDPRLRMCSLAARGLWMDMCTYQHEAEPYGHLLINGVAPDMNQLAALVGRPLDEVQAAYNELEKLEVFSRTEAGVIYSRRMVRDRTKAEIDKLNGLEGGNPTIRRGTAPKDARVRPFKKTDAPRKTERIFERDHGRCHWCQVLLETKMPADGPMPANMFQVDHVVLVCDGGTNDEDNLVAACTACHDKRRHSDNPSVTLIPTIDFTGYGRKTNDNQIPTPTPLSDSDTPPCRNPGRNFIAPVVFISDFPNSDTNPQKLEARKKIDVADDARARDPVVEKPQLRQEALPTGGERGGIISAAAFRLRDELCRVQRIDPDDPRCIGDAYQLHQWLEKGWRAEVIVEAVSVVMSRREKPPNSLRYYEQAIAQAHAERDRPLPVVKLEPQVFSPMQERRYGPEGNSKSVVAAADELLAEIRARKRSGNGSGAGLVDVSLLPQG